MLKRLAQDLAHHVFRQHALGRVLVVEHPAAWM